MSDTQLKRVAILERKLDIYMHKSAAVSNCPKITVPIITANVVVVDLVVGDEEEDADTIDLIDISFRWKPNETPIEVKKRHIAIAIVSSKR